MRFKVHKMLHDWSSHIYWGYRSEIWRRHNSVQLSSQLLVKHSVTLEASNTLYSTNHKIQKHKMWSSLNRWKRKHRKWKKNKETKEYLSTTGIYGERIQCLICGHTIHYWFLEKRNFCNRLDWFCYVLCIGDSTMLILLTVMAHLKTLNPESLQYNSYSTVLCWLKPKAGVSNRLGSINALIRFHIFKTLKTFHYILN